MANKFDEQKYKNIFEQRYGKGSFDSGLSQARQIGASKVQADLAMSALKKQRDKALKKTYDDALTYWNDPANKEHLLGRGAHNIENDYLNDPREKARVKELGFSQQDYIDAMHSASTNGTARSKREKKQQEKKQDFNVPSEKQSLIPMLNNTKKEKKEVKVPTPSKKKSNTNLWDDLKAAGKMAYQGFNPFDDVSMEDAFKEYTQRDTSKAFDEVARGSNRAVDSASLGAMSNLDKKVNNREPYYQSERKFGEGGGTDMITSGLGYLVPGVGGYKALNATKAGKALTQFGSKGIGQRLASEAGKGAIIGAGMSGTEVGIREGLNPDDYNWKQNLGYIGLNTGIGAVADPLLYGAGKGIAKGFEKSTSNVMEGLLPKNEQLAKSFATTLKADTALPIQSNKPNPLLMNDLIPRGTDVAKPNFLPSLTPQVKKPAVTVPKVGKPAAELTPLQETSVVDRAAMLDNTERQMPDFSYGRQTSEPNPPVNVYGAEVPFDKVQHAPSDYWRGRYEDFAKYVNQNYDTNNLNQEALEDLWSQFAKYDEPVTLNQLVDLAYKVDDSPVLDTRNVWDKMGNRSPVPQNAKKLLGLDGNGTPKQAPAPAQSLLPELNVNRTVQEPVQSLIPNVNRNTPEPPVTPQEQPVRTSEPPSSNLKERGHIETLRNSDNATESLKERIKGLYKPTTNEEAVTIANKYLAQGAETATSFVKNARVLKPEHVATAHRLIQEFQRTGQIDKAVDIAEHIAERGTKAGQAVQAFSIFDKLSPEGILVHANRVADRVNAKLNPLQQKVVITNETAAQLTDLATSVQKATQQKTIANDLVNLMDKAKAGGKLTDAESKQIRQFVDDAKQWISDITPKKTTPKAPNKIIKPEVKEQVVKFLDKQEEAARKRLAARKGRALSGLPVDDFYDYAVIGASKLAKKTINFAEFSEQMIREFGEEIRPHIQQVYDKSSEMVSNEVQRTVNRLSEVQKITNKALKNGKLEEADAENLRKFALSINNMSGDVKIQASQELQGVLQGLERPSFLRQVSSAQTIAQLLNPKTLGRNALGNEMFYRLERLNKLVATPIDWAKVSVFGGKRAVTFQTNNQAEYWKNWLRGWNAGLKGVNPEGLSTQYDLYPNSFNGKWNPMKYLEKTLGAALKSFDYAGYKRGVNNTIGELATLRAMNEGLTGQAKKEAIARYIREVDENALMIADQYGKYVTFQDNNIIAVGLQKFKRGLNVGKEFGMGDLIIKYPKTPGALLARALEYSPAGFLKSLYEISKPFYKKGYSTNEVIESFTRALIGSAGTMGIAWFLADKGIITGSGSKDFDVKELEKSSGKTEYSINMDALKRFVFSGFDGKAAETQKGDSFISYNWAQPIAMAVAIGANASNNANNSGKPSLAGSAWEATNGALDSLVGMSVLQGVQRAFTSYPGQSAGDKLMDIAGQLPASFVPTISNQIRQKADNTGRNVYDPLKLNQFKNQAKNKVPVLESLLPAGYDTLGKQKEVYKDKSNSFFNVFLNPAFVNRYNPSPEAEMVLKVINDTGDETLAPRRAQKYLMIDGKRYDLTPQQYSDYQRRLGTEVRTQLQSLNPSSPSEALGAKISKVLDAAGRKVRNELKAEYGE
jgi:hypothetical protein